MSKHLDDCMKKLGEQMRKAQDERIFNTLYGAPVYVDPSLRDDESIIFPRSGVVHLPPGRVQPAHRYPDNSQQQLCFHDWHTDQYFSAKKYTTCRKCGAKQEDL